MFLENIKKFIDNSDFFKEISQAIQSQENNLQLAEIPRSAKALVAAFIWKKFNKNVIFVSIDDKMAEDYMDDFDILCGKHNCFYLPDFEVLPYEERSPHYSIRAQRVNCLAHAVLPEHKIFSLSYRSLLRRITPKSIFSKYIKHIKVDEEINLEKFISELVGLGYNLEYQVAKTGDIARRGGIIDIFPPNLKNPVRVELFGDTIDSIRPFKVVDQKSSGQEIKSFNILPAREFSLHDIPGDNKIWKKIPNADFYEGIENDLPIIFPENDSFLTYFSPENTIVIWDEFQYIEDKLEEIHEEATELYLKAKKKQELIPDPNTLFTSQNELNFYLKKYLSYFSSASAADIVQKNREIFSEFEAQTTFESSLPLLESDLEKKTENGFTIFIQSDNKSQKKRMQELLTGYDEQLCFTVGVFQKGFVSEQMKLAVYTDHEIFNRYKRKKYSEKYAADQALIDYDSLNVGDYIVHINHGIGVFRGLKKMQINGSNIECLVIEYAKRDKIYVPTNQINLVTKFVSEEGYKPKVNKIGGKKWAKSKRNAKKQIELVAQDLVNLYAERKIRRGISFDKDNEWQMEMENSFIYEDTPDQKRATEEIKADMEEEAPMERLLCGDVGFGKTEVAIRAAFKAVVSGYQVAVLVPTTLLSEQHYYVFKERLAQYPINIEMFNRFRTNKRLGSDIVKLANGEIDIAIGTHRLLSKDMQFDKLGLLIIDEEHRFGVQHKDRIRKKWSHIDTLYMSATPIPRTLSMALSKLKELSLMQTSPKARLPIRTVVTAREDEVIKDAIRREVDRGGQVFFVHNRVKTIESVANRLRNLLPKVKFEIGHGQLPEKKLERVMVDFSHHKFDVLVATTIIENGIDIPNANTIIVDRADNFGLAQLYQMRGRVGRSNRRAYAYLLVPPKLTDIARKRIETLTEYNSLGAGYQIAMRDLELRGAGSLLGNKQSGTINSVGFNFYSRLLNQAIENLSKENPDGMWAETDEEKEIKMHIQADYYFPKNYVSDDKARLKLYQRMVDFKTDEDFEDFREEIRDRFGEIPDPVSNTILYFKMRNMVRQSILKSFNLRSGNAILEFHPQRLPKKEKIHSLIKEFDFPVSFDTSKGLKISLELSQKALSEKEAVLKKTIRILKFIRTWKIAK